MKRLLSVLLCLMLVFSMALTTFATGTDPEAETVTLTLNGTATGHTYRAYQIFSGTIDSGVLVDYKWGSGFASQEDGQAFLDALKLDETKIYNSQNPSQYTTMKAQLAGIENLDGLLTVMESWGNNLDRIDFFADFLKDGYLTGTYADTTSSTTTYVFEDLAPGYYLIMDVTESEEDLVDDFYTKFIISMTDTTTVNVKGDVPTVTKKVAEALNGDYSEAITNQLNRIHYYEWIGEIPNTIAYYDFYYYAFTDTMSAGLDFNRIEEIYIQTANSKVSIYNANAENPIVNAGLMPDTYPTAPITGYEEKTIQVVWNDLLEKYGDAIEASDSVVIRYSAMLNDYAVVGKDGTDNEVTLTYSNSPNDDSKHGVTPPNDARVYTFGMELTKIDGEDGDALKGAEFYLYHNHTEVGEDGKVDLVPQYAKVEVVQVPTGETAADGTAITVAENRIIQWVEDKEQATRLVSGDDGKITVYGLKEKTDYYLTEEKAPEGGYNKLTAPVHIRISGYAVNGTDDKVVSISYTVDNDPKTANGDTGLITLDVENQTGTSLPSTGGMGTTLLYLAGGILVLAAVVLLVTKKRMASE